MPISLLEAMSYGNCCLTSDIPECTEVLGEYGVSFKKSDKADLSATLQKLCGGSAEVQKYKDSAQKYILEKYNWDEVCDKTLALYQK